MQKTVVAQSMGNDIWIPIPEAIVQGLGIGIGTVMNARLEGGSLVLTPLIVPDLETLLRGVKIENRPEVIDLTEVGREVVE